jgi:hypothetical protein
MMRYQKIEVNTWNDEKFVKLSQDGKMLFLYFLTCPHSNSIGAYVAKKGYISEDLKWDTKRVSKTLSELLQNGLIKYDESLSVVVVVNYLKHNTIENPNQCKSAVKNFQSLPKTNILQEVSNRLETVAKHFQISFETLTIYVSVTASVTASVTEEEKKPDKPPKPEKQKYLEFVFLTDDEYKKLVDQFGEQGTQDRISALNEGIGSKGYKYTSHYFTILSWERKAIAEGKSTVKPDNPADDAARKLQEIYGKNKSSALA